MVSDGNLSLYGIVRGTSAQKAKEQYNTCEIQPFDVALFPKWTIKEAKKTGKSQTFLVLDGAYRILKKGVKAKIGNPRNLADFNSVDDVPEGDQRN